MREASTVHSEVWGCAQFTTPTEVPRTFTKTFHTPISLGLNDIPDTVSPRQPRLSSTSPTLPLDIGDEVTILLISSYFDFISASPSIACLRACTTTTSRSLECAGSSLIFDTVSRVFTTSGLWCVLMGFPSDSPLQLARRGGTKSFSRSDNAPNGRRLPGYYLGADGYEYPGYPRIAKDSLRSVQRLSCVVL